MNWMFIENIAQSEEAVIDRRTDEYIEPDYPNKLSSRIHSAFISQIFVTEISIKHLNIYFMNF